MLGNIPVSLSYMLSQCLWRMKHKPEKERETLTQVWVHSPLRCRASKPGIQAPGPRPAVP